MNKLLPARIRWFRIRLVTLAFLCVCVATAILVRAYRIQVVHASIPGMQSRSHSMITVSPLRGSIYDRRGESLAISVDTESLWANPHIVRQSNSRVEDLALRLSLLLGVEPEKIAQRLRSERYFVWIKRHLTPKEASLVKALNMPGLSLTLEARRFYPYRELASHVLGYADIDGHGIEGLELELDDVLRGKDQALSALLDRRGKLVYSRSFFESESLRGSDVVLTLDKRLQEIAEQALAKAVWRHGGKAGSLVMLEPRTGEILAMANVPTYNPNEPGRYDPESRRNRVVTDRFEPGSTIKPFTIAGALDLGSLKPNATFDCEQGTLHIEDYVIHDSMRWGRLSLHNILSRSSNIGAAKIGMHLGRERLYNVMREFGFGERTSVRLPGENQGSLRHFRRWFEADTAAISFGQGIGVTNLQIAMAMAAIANQGLLMQPILIKQIIGSQGEDVFHGSKRVRRRVVSPQVARLVTQMLVGVTQEDGTGMEAAISGIRVAGKTGTAQKANIRSAGYADEKWLSSFAGFVPADNPKLVISIMIDEPRGEYYGGIVAGPPFREVAEQSLAYLGLIPQPEKRSARERRARLASLPKN